MHHDPCPFTREDSQYLIGGEKIPLGLDPRGGGSKRVGLLSQLPREEHRKHRENVQYDQPYEQIALVRDEQVLGSALLEGGTFSAQLVPQIARLLTENQLKNPDEPE